MTQCRQTPATRRAGSKTACRIGAPPASLAALRAGSPIDTILSLEGNLTADDAYFSGMAAAFANAAEFRTAFLTRLAELAQADANVERYRAAVESADAQALWELGVNAHEFSAAQTPGDILALAPAVAYFYNPANMSAASLTWLAQSDLERVPLPYATHWKCVDQPELLAERMIEAAAKT
jgi:pimeloyl-ACP methyl ester carboxylesterase